RAVNHRNFSAARRARVPRSSHARRAPLTRRRPQTRSRTLRVTLLNRRRARRHARLPRKTQALFQRAVTKKLSAFSVQLSAKTLRTLSYYFAVKRGLSKRKSRKERER